MSAVFTDHRIVQRPGEGLWEIAGAPGLVFPHRCSLPRDQIDSAVVAVRSVRTAKRQSHITDHEERALARISRERTTLTEAQNDLLFRLVVGVLKKYREKL